MIRILLVSQDKNSLSDMAAALTKDGIQTAWAESCGMALSKAEVEKFDLIITDEMLGDIKGIECIKKLVSFNPFINCAAVSSLSAEDFHEASEGLGILMQLPVMPGREHAEKLLEHLKNILNLTKGK